MADSRKRGKSMRKVSVTKNGPYLVSGGPPLVEQIICTDPDGQCHGWKRGKEYPVQDTYSLCRCGHSRNMPYCDETHAEIGFDGTETANRDAYLSQAKEVAGPGLKLTDAPDFCIGATFCRRGGGAWQLTLQSADPEARRVAIEEACDCPSGRLVAWEEGGKPIEPEFEQSIGLIQTPEMDGLRPFWVRGGILVESADGTPYEVRNRVALCRCGKSANKPFCDGSHLGDQSD